MNSGILYISYSGMLEPLGQSQVLAYQERLAASQPVHIISFERADDWVKEAERSAVARRMTAAGIVWHPLRYHKRFSILATAWDIIRGAVKGLMLVRRHGLDVVHARSYISSVMALVIRPLTGVKYLFDMRGFWADERVDGGLWAPGGRLYRLSKWFERRFLLSADHVVSLTRAAVDEMRQFPYLQGRMPPITVIPTCADLTRFRAEGDLPSGLVFGYVGSAGTWYLFDEVVATFCRLLQLRPDARMLVINRKEHRYIRERFRLGGVPPSAVEILAVNHADVPGQMARMHAGIFFYKPSYSRVACSPTKLGEFLGCGIPCISNTGVGDMAEVLEGEAVGVAVDGFDLATLDIGLARLLQLVGDPSIRDRCVRAAQRHFSLDEGVRRYRAVYASLQDPA